MTDRNDPPDDSLVSERRQLELVDRVLGLEAQLANQVRLTSPTLLEVRALEAEIAGLRQQLAVIHSTKTWRAGRLLLLPVRVVRRLGRRTR